MRVLRSDLICWRNFGHKSCSSLYPRSRFVWQKISILCTHGCVEREVRKSKAASLLYIFPSFLDLSNVGTQSDFLFAHQERDEVAA